MKKWKKSYIKYRRQCTKKNKKLHKKLLCFRDIIVYNNSVLSVLECKWSTKIFWLLITSQILQVFIFLYSIKYLRWKKKVRQVSCFYQFPCFLIKYLKIIESNHLISSEKWLVGDKDKHSRVNLDHSSVNIPDWVDFFFTSGL